MDDFKVFAAYIKVCTHVLNQDFRNKWLQKSLKIAFFVIAYLVESLICEAQFALKDGAAMSQHKSLLCLNGLANVTMPPPT